MPSFIRHDNAQNKANGISETTVPVSVVIPCYNVAKTLPRCLQSIWGQRQQPMEIILIDDASSDDTAALIKHAVLTSPVQIHAIFLTKNQGPANARNHGWNIARAKFVAFLDADDAWHEDKLLIQTHWMLENPDVVMSGHQCIVYPGVSGPLSEKLEVRTFGVRQLLMSNRFSTPSVMVQQSISLRFPGDKKYAEDWALWLFVAAHYGKVSRLELPLAYLFKAAYGESGLSSRLWSMEAGELAAITSLRRAGHLTLLAWLGACNWSLLKFLRRLLYQQVKLLTRSFRY